MNVGRKYPLPDVPETLSAVLLHWIEGAHHAVMNKVNQYALDLWLWEHSPKMRITRHKKPQFRWLEEPRCDQSYAAFVPKAYRDCPPQIFRNSVVYRFYQPWQLHLQDPRNFHPPCKDKEQGHSVLLTRELFKLKGNQLHILVKGKRLGILPVNVHREYGQNPSMVHISHQNGQWWLSFSFEDGQLPPTAADAVAQIIARYATADGQVLRWQDIERDANAYDFGVVKACNDKHGVEYGWTPAIWQKQLRDIDRCEKLQAAVAYKHAGSRPCRRLEQRLQNTQERVRARVQHVNHQGSCEVAKTNGYLQVIEDTNWAGLMRKCEPVYDGYEHQPNGRAAKRALTKKLRNRRLGDLQQKIEYKVEREGKLPVWISPHATSCTCIHCLHRSPGNRPRQNLFLCEECGETGNADDHSARYMAYLAANNVQFLVFALLWMQRRKEHFSGGTSVFAYLLQGRVRKTARVSLKASGLVKRVRSVIEKSGQWEGFCSDATVRLHHNPLVLFQMPPPKP